MTKEQFDNRFGNLLADVSASIRKEADRLFSCGGVDAASYGDDYELPKAVLYAAIFNVRASRRPLSKRAKEDSANLEHF